MYLTHSKQKASDPDNTSIDVVREDNERNQSLNISPRAKNTLKFIHHPYALPLIYSEDKNNMLLLLYPSQSFLSGDGVQECIRPGVLGRSTAVHLTVNNMTLVQITDQSQTIFPWNHNAFICIKFWSLPTDILYVCFFFPAIFMYLLKRFCSFLYKGHTMS